MLRSGRWIVLFALLTVALAVTGCGRNSADAADLPETTAPSTPTGAGAKLSAELAVPSTSLDGDSVPLTFTLTNNADTSVFVLTWFTPLEGILNDIFRVTRDGARIDYEGPLVMRGDPRPEDYVPLAAGESVSVEVDLAEVYDFSVPGTYTIEFVSPVFTHVAQCEEEMAQTVDDLGKVPIPSNPVTVTIVSPKSTASQALAEQGAEPAQERYANADYGFAFQYPDTWMVVDEKDRQVTLVQGTLQLVVAFNDAGDDAFLPWTGLPAGDLENQEPIPFMGKRIEKQALVRNDKVKVLVYTGEVDDLAFAIRLDGATTEDYASIDISDVVQREVDAIVGSFAPLPASEEQESLSVAGTVEDASASARVITLVDAANGIRTIALTEECQLVSAEGATMTLNEVRPGMLVEASGQRGETGVLIASRVHVTSE
ncbi:MAG: hypothetical protein ACP5HS_09160 [Anaerolineae bacterium]